MNSMSFFPRIIKVSDRVSGGQSQLSPFPEFGNAEVQAVSEFVEGDVAC